jgi:hypothetical protein
VVKMTALKSIFENLKLREVETFIASGNVIFRSAAEPPKLEAMIELPCRQVGGSTSGFCATGRRPQPNRNSGCVAPWRRPTAAAEEVQ